MAIKLHEALSTSSVTALVSAEGRCTQYLDTWDATVVQDVGKHMSCSLNSLNTVI